MGRMGPGVAIRTAVILAASACRLTAFADEEIHGAGATFPAPLYAAWSAEYRRSSGVGVTFDAVGSGEGIERIRGRRVDFGASDAALTPQELTASGLLQFPVVIGGVVPVINIRGIKPGQLKLSGALLADIYLGKITRWNDVSIAALNPALALPNANITVVHRSDLSGSTLLWTDYLSRSSAAWRESGLGVSLEPRWPSGIGGKGNEGVASFVQRTRSAIGYVEFIYARNHHLSDVALRNQSGTFVQAGRDAFAAAAAAADRDGTAPMQQQLATDLPGTASWPITGASFILIPQPTANSAKTLAVLRFFNWALHQGEPITRGLEYAPLPKAWVDQLPTLWAAIRDSTGQPVWP
jgi:phosphate transport system substrate-binding protein